MRVRFRVGEWPGSSPWHLEARLRGTSRRVGVFAGEGVPSRAQRELLPSVMLVSGADGGGDSRRAID